MTAREARAIARENPTAIVFEVVVPRMFGPQAGDVVTWAGIIDDDCAGFECVATRKGSRSLFSADEGWALEASRLRPLNAASRRALAQVSR